MGFLSFVGRVLLIIIFIGGGVDKFLHPQNSVAFLNARYPGFHKLLETYSKQYSIPLPEQLSPKAIKEQSNHIILGVGAAEIGLGLLVILNQGWAGVLLSFLTLSFVAVIHNPFIHGTTQTEKLSEQIQALWTIGIAGALLIVGAPSGKASVPAVAPAAPKSKGVVPTPPNKKSKRN